MITNIKIQNMEKVEESLQWLKEIEKTPLGKAAISTNDEGYKIVDYGKLGGTMLFKSCNVKP